MADHAPHKCQRISSISRSSLTSSKQEHISKLKLRPSSGHDHRQKSTIDSNCLLVTLHQLRRPDSEYHPDATTGCRRPEPKSRSEAGFAVTMKSAAGGVNQGGKITQNVPRFTSWTSKLAGHKILNQRNRPKHAASPTSHTFKSLALPFLVFELGATSTQLRLVEKGTCEP